MPHRSIRPPVAVVPDPTRGSSRVKTTASLALCIVGMLLAFVMVVSRGEAQANLQCDPDALKVRAGANTLPETLVGNTTYCLTESGIYSESDDQWRITNPNIKLQEASGVEAEMRGTIRLTEVADGFTFEGIYLDGSYGVQNKPGYRKCPFGCDTWTTQAMFIDGTDNFTLTGGFEITNRRPNGDRALAGQCVYIAGAGSTSGLIEHGFLHHCGQIPRNNHEHAVYAAHARGLVVRGNLIHRSADRALQLYPNADNSLIEGNVFAYNGNVAVHFSGRGRETSDNNLVRNNVITHTNDWNVSAFAEQLAAGVEFPKGSANRNDVLNNCVSPGPNTKDPQTGGIQPTAKGNRDYFYSQGNVTANPQYSGSWEEGAVKVISPECAAKLPDGSRFVRP